MLADAISYALAHLSPSMMIDLATLTGAIAIVPKSAGLFVNDDLFAHQLASASADTFKRLWRMPLFPAYCDALKIRRGRHQKHRRRPGGSILADIFLQEFVNRRDKHMPWAHIDIASTAYLPDARRYNPKVGKGFSMPLLISFLEALAKT